MGEEINVRISTLQRGATSDRHHYVSTSGNSESFQRNNRMKISHANEANDFTPGLCLLGNDITSYNPWPAQPSHATAPSTQSLDSSYLGSNLGPRKQHNLRTQPVISLDLYPFPQSGISTTEVGSSSGSPAIAVDCSVVELDQLHAPINISEQVSVSPISTMNMMPDQTNWHSTSGTTVLSGNSVPTSQIGTNLGVHQSSGANWLTHQNRRRISEAVHRNFLSSGFECRGQTISLPPHQNNSSTSQEVGRRQSGAVSRALQHPYSRLNMLHRQNSGALGIPLAARTPAAARERRNRMSEVCNITVIFNKLTLCYLNCSMNIFCLKNISINLACHILSMIIFKVFLSTRTIFCCIYIRLVISSEFTSLLTIQLRLLYVVMATTIKVV